MKKASIILSILAFIAGSCGTNQAKYGGIYQLNSVGEDGGESIDITALINREAIFLGMIGDKNQKMGIAFLSITKTGEKQYEVTGKSKVKENVCNFKGTMEVQSAEENRDGEYFDGTITGKYLFEEDKNQSGTGVFEGTFEIEWNNEILHTFFDGITVDGADFEAGATFGGTWKSYRTGATSKACWGNMHGCKPCCINDGQELQVAEEYRSSGWALEIDMREDNWRTQHNTADEKLKKHPDYPNWFEWWK